MASETQGSTSDKLDLHGYTVADAVERFVEQYNRRVKNGQSDCWTIIHGYGSSGEGGIIRSKFRAFLDQHLDKLRYEPGDDYGDPGWTWVYPKVRLPDRRERMALEILGFCSAPRSEEKILAKFARHGGIQVKKAIRALVKQGRLKPDPKGAKLQYRAVAPAAVGSTRNI